MPLAASSGYKSALDGSLDEHWIVEIANSAGSYVRLATKDFGSGTSQYHGYIVNKPTIRESIDLVDSKSTTSNITISCLNKTISNISGATPKLSEEIYGGSRHYINRDVTVKSRLDSSQDLTIYTGRLKSVTLKNNDIVDIVIATKTPIDFLKVPELTSKAGKFFPLAYGLGVPADSTVSVPGYTDTARCFPLEVDSLNNNKYNCLAYEPITVGSFSDTGANNDGTAGSMTDDPTDILVNTVNSTGTLRFAQGDVIKINNEQMLIISVPRFASINEFFDVQRGYNSTTIAAHSSNQDIHRAALSSGITDGKLHFPITDMFDSNGFPLFVPLDNNNAPQNNSTNIYEGVEDDDKPVLQTALNLKRAYLIRPQTVTFLSNNLTVANSGNAYDTNNSSFAQFSFTATTDTSTVARFILDDLPREVHSIKECKLHFKTQVTAFDEPTGSGETLIWKYQVTPTFGGDNSVSNTGSNITAVQGSAVTSTINFLDSTFSNANAQVPESITLNFFADSDGNIANGSGDSHGLTYKVYDIYLEITAEIDPESSDKDIQTLLDSNVVQGVDKLYTGADGLDQNWAAGTTVTNIVQMHRDLIHRYAGITATPENYSDLNTARSSWTIFYYLNEQEKLTDLLEQCQKEGGFVFRFKANDGSPQYIFIGNSESVDHTISKNDIKATKVSITPFDDLITKRIVKYQRNSINDELLFEKTCTDTTNNPRTIYNVQSDENISTDELTILNGGIGDTNMGGNRNNGFANYYNALHGIPKLIIDTEIVNPGSSGGSNYFYLMEVGDIVAFNHSNQIAAPFGASYDGKKFIVTSLIRSIGTLKLILREI